MVCCAGLGQEGFAFDIAGFSLVHLPDGPRYVKPTYTLYVLYIYSSVSNICAHTYTVLGLMFVVKQVFLPW